MQGVQSLVLKTVSHDQGWCSEGSESWTWFEAIRATESRPMDKLAGFTWPKSSRLRLNHNSPGNPEPQEQITTWSLESDDESIRAWLRSIQPGDWIQILPRAKFLRWVNVVYEAELAVSWTRAQDMSTRPKNYAPQNTHHTPKYRPLDVDQREIRILEIEPGCFDDPLVCSLVYTSLSNSEHTQYTALSYCWGPQEDPKTITLHVQIGDDSPIGPLRAEIDIPIAPNLHSALRHMRHETGPCRALWADAVCINQVDIEERNQQVAIMNDIYACARDVCIWLGEGDENTRIMLDYLKPFTRAFEEDPSSFLQMVNSDMNTPHGQDSNGPESYVSISHIFSLPWFTRVWVLQEAFNAKTATVKIGRESLPWPLVARIGNCMENAKEKARSMGNLTMPAIFSTLFSVSVESSRISVTKGRSEDLLPLFVDSLDLDATDPRDKIFALLSLWKDTDLRQLPDELRPDYHKPPFQVFADFTRYWIKTHHSLRILSAVHAALDRTWQRMSPNPCADLLDDRPSWSVWHTGSSSWAKGTLAYDPQCLYASSESMVPDAELLETPLAKNILTLKGLRICSIRDIRPYPWNENPQSDSDLDRAFEKVFDPTGDLGTWTPGASTAHLVRPKRDDLVEDHLIAHMGSTAEHDGAVPCISPCAFSSNSYRGDLTGLCPYTARVGDIVVVLFGGNVPYLIRERPANETTQRKGVQYSFVGECFVSGYMFGEAIVDWRNGQLRLEQFELV